MTEIRFADGTVHQAAWLCYINGLEIPIEGADITFGVWQMPTASIRLTPHPIMQRIGAEDRLQVVLFFLDEFYEPGNPQFRLWTEYEVIGWGYASGSGSRQLQLDCVAQIQIFKQMHFSHLSAYKDAVLRKNVNGVSIGGDVYGTGGAVTVIPEVDTTVTSISGTHRRSFVRRPIDLVLHIFRAILSPVYTKPKAKQSKDPTLDERLGEKTRNIDDPKTPKGMLGRRQTSVISKNFYARWMKMTGFHKRWFALPLFEDDVVEGGCFPIIKETGGYSALRSLQKHSGPRKGSAWDMFMRIYTKMYMEIAMMPAPASAAIQKGTGKIIGKDITNLDSQFKGLMSYCVKPQCLFSLPPMCNVLFPSLTGNQSFQESYMAQPTRIKIRGGHGSNLIRQLTSGTSRLFRSIVKQLLHAGYPSVVYKRSKAYEKAPGANDENFLIFPEEMFKGPIIKHMSPPPWMRQIQKRVSGIRSKKEAKETLDERIARKISGNELKVTTPESTQNLFQKYAEYEYFRARYEKRSGGASNLFQPFLVPGFPCVQFDQRASGFDTIGYLTSVTHTYSRAGGSPSISTRTGVAFIRTLQENVRDKIREPISSIREILQDKDNADLFYRSLLFRKDDVSKPVTFVQEDVVETKNKKYEVVGPTEQYAQAFEDYNTAMKLVARPTCTLKEYIEVYHGKDLETLIDEGIVLGENRTFYSVIKDPTPDKVYGGAVYWSRIYKLKQGAGPNPGAKVTNVQDDDDASPVIGGFTPVDDTHGDMPQTRYDWDTVLERYRSILYSEGIGSIPQE
jgi:hypothetical protein